MDTKTVIRETGTTSKRRKDKENINTELSERQEKKRALRHEWQQNDIEITVLLHVGSSIDINQIKWNCSDQNCCVKLEDGREWACSFYRHVVGEGTGLHQKSNKLFVKMIKKVPNEHWPYLEYQPEEETTTSNIKVEEKKAVYELDHVKHDSYEEATESLCLTVYVKNIKKDTLEVLFEEKHLSIKFQTMDSKFLSMYKPATEETSFLWRIHLQDAIKPSQCRFKLTTVKLEIVLKKKLPRKWGGLEALTNKGFQVPTNTYLPISKSQAQTTSIPSGQTVQLQPQNKIAESGANSISPVSCPPRVVSRSRETLPTTRWSDRSRQQDLTTGRLHKDEMGDKKEVAKKPTCMVPPLSKSKQQTQVVIPGLTGLDNLGNTCFMNSVLQCLANTREFRDYFLDCLFQSEINTDNPLGMGGKLAVAFAVLIKVLWSGTHRSYPPTKLKTLIGMKAAQFTGFAQHDAQEFMAFLLDGLHEDLNRIKNKPYIENTDSDGRPDEVVAEESWHLYKQRNDSIVVDLFQGQYKSKLVCPVCCKVSITFDPFLYLSLPLPKKQKALPVYFFSKDPYQRPTKYIVMLAQDATVEELKEKICLKTGVLPSNLRIFEIYKHKIQKFFGKGSSLSAVNPTDQILIFEVFGERLAGEPVIEFAVIQRTLMPCNVVRCSNCQRECPSGDNKLRRCTKCYRVGYCDHNCQREHWGVHRNNCKLLPEVVGCPFILSLPESQATFNKLCRLMEAFARYSIDVFQPPVQFKDTIKRSSSLCVPEPSLLTDSHLIDKDFTSRSHKEGNSNIQTTTSCTDSGTSSTTSSACSSLHTSSGSISLGPAGDVASLSSGVVSDASSNPGNNIGDGIGVSESNSSSSITDTVLPILRNKAHESDSLKLEAVASSSSRIAAELESHKEDMEKGVEEDKEECEPPDMSASTSMHVTENLNRKTYSGRILRPLSVPTDSFSSDPGTSYQTKTRVVFGQPQEKDADRMTPHFYICPVNQNGQSLPGVEGECLMDKGNEPLNLSSHYYLAMDWKNNEKMKDYVMVQSKELEYDYNDQDLEHLKSESGEVTLEQCLQLFTEPEVLSPQEAWYCPQCEAHREATKQLSLWRLPPVMIIQLKRFSFKNFIWRDKIDRMVEFPIRSLDLSSYFCGPHANMPVYDLFAVINHHGGILGGHYTSFARCTDLHNTRRSESDWRLFDDSRVTFVPDSSVVTQAAYMLFYRRRGQPFTLPQTVVSSSFTSSNKEQKQKENMLDLELTSEPISLESISVVDSNILSYSGEDSSSSSVLSEMDTVD